MKVRKIDKEDRAAAGRALEPDRAAKSCDDLPDDIQAEAASAPLPRVRCIGLREPLEDLKLETIWNTHPPVPHGHADGVVQSLDRQDDLASGRRELECVREKIGQNLYKPIGVGVDVGGLGTAFTPNFHAV